MCLFFNKYEQKNEDNGCYFYCISPAYVFLVAEKGQILYHIIKQALFMIRTQGGHMEIGKDRIFIGSSSESLKYAYALQAIMYSDYEITVWDQDIFKPSQTAIESLVEGLSNFDFAVFIMSSDDKILSRGREYECTRDNIIFEIGLFMGRLGRDRVFLIKPLKKEIKIPTDLLGIHILEYESGRTDGNDKAAMGSIKYNLSIRMKKVMESGLTSAASRPQDSGQAADELSESALARQIGAAAGLIHHTFNDQCWILHIDIDKPKSIRTVYGDETFISVIKTCKELISGFCQKKFRAEKWEMMELSLHENSILILAEKSGQESALRRIADQIVDTIHKYDWDELAQGLYVTCSIGIADSEEFHEDARTAVFRAVIGSKKSKKKGGNCVSKSGHAKRHAALITANWIS